MATAPGGAQIDIGRVIQRGFQTIGRQIGPFAIMALLLVGGPAILTALLFGREMTSVQVDPTNLDAFLSPTFWLLILLSIITGFLLQAAIVRASIRDLRGERVDIASNLVEALKLVLPMIGLAILTSLVIGIGLVLLVVPGIIFYIMLIVAVPVLVEERRGVIGSMSRSSELTKGSRWRIFLLVVLFLVVSWIVSFAIGIALTPLLYSATFVALLIQSVISSLLGLLVAAMLASLYFELRMVKEGVSAEGLAAIFA